MSISFYLNHGYNFLMLPIGLPSFLIGFTLFALSLKLYVSFHLSSSSWCFLNVCLHELNDHFWLLECMCNIDGLHLSCSLTNFFLMLFACTLESLLNQSKGDGMSNRWLVKLFIIVAKCCPIAHFHVIVICLWLQDLVDCCNFIHLL
jgi:hypothetical protein